MTTKPPAPTRAAASKAARDAVAALATGTILLDGKPISIRPLKVGVLKRAMISVSEMEGMAGTPENATRLLDLMTDTVATAAGMSPSEVDELADQGELQTAFGRVLSFSGAREAVPGEAPSRGR